MNGEIERFLTARVADDWTAGAAWWIATADRIVDRGAVGHATRFPKPEPLTAQTPFDLASLTKPLVTAALLVFAEQDGLLALDRPAGNFLEELSGSPWAGSTLFSLATHTSGLPGWKPLCATAGSVGGYLRAIARTPRALPAGEALYSDLGYILLGEVITRVAGQSLAQLFRERIARPLDLKRTGFAGSATAFPDAAATELGNGFERELAGPAGADYPWRRELIRGEVHDANAHGLGGVAGHAGLFAPIDELGRLGAELLRPRRLPLGRRARSRLLEVTSEGAGRTVGFVSARHSRAASGILPGAAPGHTGFTGTSLWLDPTRELCAALLTNRVHPRVSGRDFQLVRRGFHRLALKTAGAAS